MRNILILLLLLAVPVLVMGTAGCGEDEVKVQRSYEGTAPPPSKQADEGETVYQRSVTIESDDFDDDDGDDDDEVKIQRSSETTSESQEMLITP